MRRNGRVLAAGVVVALVVVACLSFFAARMRLKRNLPYRDSFATGRAEEWTAYGGSWRLKDGTMVNRSDERGAKVITGSSGWTNYSIEAETMMLGHGGDVGLLVRVTDPEKGINAYRGYYVGLRSQDQALVMGVADHDWIEVRPVAVLGGVGHLVWYRLKVFAVDCQIVAQVENQVTHQTTWSAMQANPCFRSGMVGFRSLNTGAAYRNVRVEHLAAQDVTGISTHLAAPDQERYPVREADYARMKESYYASPERLLESLVGPPGNPVQEPLATVPRLESIHSLEMTRKPESVRIHGVVTLADPTYLQDDSGGIRVHLSSPNTLNVGDEVELTGKMQPGRAAPFEVATYRVLWESNPLTPASISSTQAASGAFDGTYIELSGVLRSGKELQDGTLVLDMEDIAQHFSVRVPRGLSGAMPTWWQIGSTMRVQGVCISAPQDVSESAFTMLLRDANDVEYLSAPPWSRGIRLALLIVAGVLSLLFWAMIYIRGEQRRMRFVLMERELLAAEMHDTLAQSFAGVGFHLQSIRRGLQLLGSVPDPLMLKVDVACGMAVTAHREASERIALLRHRRHQDGDLLDQLNQSAIAMLSGSHIGIRLYRSGVAVHLHREVEDALLAIGGEAIANIFRHSQAREMVLSLNYGRRAVELRIEDDGVGFDASKTPPGVGRKGMELRARQVQGSFQMVSTTASGTAVFISVRYRGRSRMEAWVRSKLGRERRKER